MEAVSPDQNSFSPPRREVKEVVLPKLFWKRELALEKQDFSGQNWLKENELIGSVGVSPSKQNDNQILSLQEFSIDWLLEI